MQKVLNLQPLSRDSPFKTIVDIISKINICNRERKKNSDKSKLTEYITKSILKEILKGLL